MKSSHRYFIFLFRWDGCMRTVSVPAVKSCFTWTNSSRRGWIIDQQQDFLCSIRVHDNLNKIIQLNAWETKQSRAQRSWRDSLNGERLTLSLPLLHVSAIFQYYKRIVDVQEMLLWSLCILWKLLPGLCIYS